MTNSRSIYEKAASLGSYERLCTFGEDSQVRRYALTGMGYKFRIHPLAVAIADAGLDELEERNQIRNDNGRYFEAGIADLDCFVPQQVLKGARGSTPTTICFLTTKSCAAFPRIPCSLH